MRIPTGTVTPSTHGPHVEQVGWGVGRQVLRRLREDLGLAPDEEAAEELGLAAERHDTAVYAVLDGMRVLAIGRLDLAAASYTLIGALPDAGDTGALDALLVRALHDAAAHGLSEIRVEGARSAPEDPT